MNKKPMSLKDFLALLRGYATKGQWTHFKIAVAKRKKYFEENPKEGTF